MRARRRCSPTGRQGRCGDGVKILNQDIRGHTDRNNVTDGTEIRCAILQLKHGDDHAAAGAAGGEAERLRYRRAIGRDDTIRLRIARQVHVAGSQQRGHEVGRTCGAVILDGEVDGHRFARVHGAVAGGAALGGHRIAIGNDHGERAVDGEAYRARSAASAVGCVGEHDCVRIVAGGQGVGIGVDGHGDGVIRVGCERAGCGRERHPIGGFAGGPIEVGVAGVAQDIGHVSGIERAAHVAQTGQATRRTHCRQCSRGQRYGYCKVLHDGHMLAIAGITELNRRHVAQRCVHTRVKHQSAGEGVGRQHQRRERVGHREARQHVVMGMVAIHARIGVTVVVDRYGIITQVSFERGHASLGAGIRVEIACHDNPCVCREVRLYECREVASLRIARS